MLLSNRPGYIASGSAHAALLVATLLSFSQSHKFDDAQESVPVEMVTSQQFSEMQKGEKTAKELKQRVDKVADLAETKPQPPVAEAKRDIPTPPPPLQRQPDPGEADTKDVPTPPQKSEVTPEPPKPAPKPAPVKPPPPTPQVAEKPPAPDAEPLIPKPPKRPDFAREEPKKQEPQFKPDQVAKLLEKQKDEPQKPVDKPVVAKPKSGDESEPQHKFSVSDISRLLSKEAPQRQASTGSQLQRVASLGTANAHAAKMTPFQSDQLDGLLKDQYKQCWDTIGLSSQKKYNPEIGAEYAADGTLIGQPVLLNPPTDPADRSLADSAMRAVRRCNPLHIPPMFQPFYDEWNEQKVKFNPDEMS